MFAELADEPKLVAIKESSENVRRITDLKNVCGDRYLLFCGVDDLVLESLLLGATGWVSGLVNAFPAENRLLWDLATAGRWDEAREVYRWYTPLLAPRYARQARPVHQARRSRSAGSAPRRCAPRGCRWSARSASGSWRSSATAIATRPRRPSPATVVNRSTDRASEETERAIAYLGDRHPHRRRADARRHRGRPRPRPRLDGRAPGASSATGYDTFRSAVVNEPRGSDVMVGALALRAGRSRRARPA